MPQPKTTKQQVDHHLDDGDSDHQTGLACQLQEHGIAVLDGECHADKRCCGQIVEGQRIETRIVGIKPYQRRGKQRDGQGCSQREDQTACQVDHERAIHLGVVLLAKSV